MTKLNKAKVMVNLADTFFRQNIKLSQLSFTAERNKYYFEKLPHIAVLFCIYPAIGESLKISEGSLAVGTCNSKGGKRPQKHSGAQTRKAETAFQERTNLMKFIRI